MNFACRNEYKQTRVIDICEWILKNIDNDFYNWTESNEVLFLKNIKNINKTNIKTFFSKIYEN